MTTNTLHLNRGREFGLPPLCREALPFGHESLPAVHWNGRRLGVCEDCLRIHDGQAGGVAFVMAVEMEPVNVC